MCANVGEEKKSERVRKERKDRKGRSWTMELAVKILNHSKDVENEHSDISPVNAAKPPAYTHANFPSLSTPSTISQFPAASPVCAFSPTNSQASTSTDYDLSPSTSSKTSTSNSCSPPISPTAFTEEQLIMLGQKMLFSPQNRNKTVLEFLHGDMIQTGFFPHASKDDFWEYTRIKVSGLIIRTQLVLQPYSSSYLAEDHPPLDDKSPELRQIKQDLALWAFQNNYQMQLLLGKLALIKDSYYLINPNINAFMSQLHTSTAYITNQLSNPNIQENQKRVSLNQYFYYNDVAYVEDRFSYNCFTRFCVVYGF